MPLTISVTKNPATSPVLDTRARIAQLAQALGITAPSGHTMVGLTTPAIRSDQTALQWETRNKDTEFRFNTGTLSLTLSQEIRLSSDLSACARGIWLLHEQKHVKDNEQILSRMDAELRRDAQFAAILVNPTSWLPKAQFQATQNTIRSRVAAVFQRLTAAAVQALDTPQEYAGVESQISTSCP